MMTYFITATIAFSIGVVVGVYRHWQIATDSVETAEKLLHTARLVELNRRLAAIQRESDRCKIVGDDIEERIRKDGGPGCGKYDC